MRENLSRRALLAAMGSAAIAGCFENDDGKPSTATPGENTAGETPGSKNTQTPANPSPPDSIDGSWPMPAADPGRSNYNSDSRGPSKPVSPLWEKQTEAELLAPVLANELLFLVDSDGGVLAVDARTGETDWRQSLSSTAGKPWVQDGTLFVQTNSAFVALDPDDGGERWRVAVPDRAADLVAAHGLYTVSKARNEVLAFDLEDGTERWRTEVDDPWIPTLFASENHVFLSTGTKASVPWGFDPETGQFLQDLLGRKPQGKVHHASGERFYLNDYIYTSEPFYGRVSRYRTDKLRNYEWVTNVGLGNSSSSGGAEYVAAGSENLYASGHGRSNPFHAFSLSDGAESWRVTGIEGLTARPVVTTENVYIRTQDALRCFAVSDGTERWSLSGAKVGKQCIVVDDLVYTADGTTIRAFRPA